MTGTDWAVLGTGVDLATLLSAMGEPVKDGDETRTTNLRLTGLPITDYDRRRLALATVGSLGSFTTPKGNQR